MAKKKVEEEIMEETNDEEKSLPKKNKAVPYVQRWFDDYVVNDKDDIKIICQNTATSIAEQFSININGGFNVIYAAAFYETFLSILKFIREKQKTYNEFSINIADLVVVGYTNNDDDANEKVGNFFPFVEYIGKYTKVINDDDRMASDKTTSNVIRWKELNVKQNIEFMKKIQLDAFESISKNMKINLRTDEAIIPIFCTFMYYVAEYMKYKFKEANHTEVSEVKMNVLGLFDIFYSYDEEEGKEIVDIVPGIKMKLELKMDNVADRGR